MRTPWPCAVLAAACFLVAGPARALDVWLDSVFGPPDTVEVGSIVRFGAYAVARYPATGRVYYRLDINGVRVYDDDENFDLGAGDSVLFDWPVICQDTGCYWAADSMVVNFGRDDSTRVDWCFRVVPAQGAVEQRPASTARCPITASIVRGVLWLGRVGSRQHTAYRAELLDVSGRRVLDLRPGANDLSRLAPGVYFIRSGPSAVSREPSAGFRQPSTVTKVVLTK